MPAVDSPLPAPRGPLSAALLAALVRPPRPLPATLRRLATAIPEDGGADALADEDLQLSLHLCYELHYRGLAGVDERWEWQPSLLGVRAALEARLERALLELAEPLLPAGEVAAADVPRALAAVVAADDGPALSAYMHRKATAEQWRELLVHRSAYQLKEADPHTWAIRG